MAKKEEKPKTVLERVYNIPLRKQFLKTPKWKRTKKAVKAVREFIAKHMKAEDVKIGKYLNLELWKHGIRNPAHHIKVKASKDDKGTVKVELAELSKEAILEKEKAEKEAKEKEKKKKEEEKPKEEKKPEVKEKEEKIEEKVEEAKEEKAEEAKKIEKEELKELKKEQPKIKAPKEAPMPKDVEQRPTAPMQK